MSGNKRNTFIGNLKKKEPVDAVPARLSGLALEMARREECIPRWLWHAFDALDNAKTGTAPLTELRVLTAHIGNSLAAENSSAVANTLAKTFTDSNNVGFEAYRRFLEEQRFLVLENIDLAKLEEVSWMICGDRYDRRSQCVLGQGEVYKLWRIFNFFAEPGVFPVVLVLEEATIMFEKLVVAMGMKWSSESFQFKVAALMKDLQFMSCLLFFERHYADKVMDKMCVFEGVTEVYNNIVEEVEKMGQLRKKGHKVTNWKDRWFILKPGSLSYYVDKTLREQKGTIPITTSWKMQIIPDQKGNKNMFVLSSDDMSQDVAKRRYEMSASDPKTRQEWLTALENIKRRMECGESPHLRALERRREARRQRKEDAEEVERLRRLQMEESERQRRRLLEMEEERDRAAMRAETEQALRMTREKEEKEKRAREMEERARKEQELDALRAARDEAERQAEAEQARRIAQEKEEEENRRREMEEKARIEEEIERLRVARDRASLKAAEELALRVEKEQEEMRRRTLEQEERERTQREIDFLKAAQEEAERRAQEEAAKRATREKEEEERRRAEEEERADYERQLEELKRAYEDAAKRAEIEARLKEANEERLTELSDSVQQLELLLEAERQAKRDEEIVRDLQARILQEEMERREKLEQLREEQETMLKREQEKREHLEQWSGELAARQQEQAAQLEAEREKLRELAEERKAADEKLKTAMEKLSLAEEAKRRQEQKKRELEKPVGLARLIQPSAKPLTTHRGFGAFTEEMFAVEKERRQKMRKQESPSATDASSDSGPSEAAIASDQDGHVTEVNGVCENDVEGER